MSKFSRGRVFEFGSKNYLKASCALSLSVGSAGGRDDK